MAKGSQGFSVSILQCEVKSNELGLVSIVQEFPDVVAKK